MSFEVAAVHATLGFKVEGATEAARFTEQVTAAQEALQSAVGNTSAQVQSLANDLQGAVARLEEVQNASVQLESALSEVGSSLSTLESDLSSTNSALDAQNQRIAEAQAAYDAASEAVTRQVVAVKEAAREYGLATAEYNKARDIEKELIKVRDEAEAAVRDETAAIDELITKMTVLNAVSSTQAQLPIVETEAAADVERLTGRLSGMTGTIESSGGALKKFGSEMVSSRTLMTGLLSTAQTGRITMGALTQTIFSAAAALGVWGAVAGIAAIVAGVMVVKLAGMADAMNAANPASLNLSRSLQDLEGVDLTGLASQLDNISNRLTSFGVQNTEDVASEIARIGSTLALLDGVTGNAAAGISDVQRALESLNFEKLRDYGFPVDELKARLEDLGDASEATRREVAGQFLSAWTSASDVLQEAADTAEREANTFAGLKAEVMKLWETGADSGVLQGAMAELVKSLRALLIAAQPLIKVMAFFAALMAGGVFVAIKAVTLIVLGLARGIEGLLFVASKVPVIGEAFKEAHSDVKGFADRLEGAVFGNEEFGNSASQAADDLFRFGDEAENGATKFQKFRDSLSAGFSTIGNVKSIAQAFADIQDGLDPNEGLAYFEAISQGIDDIANKGSEAVLREFEVLRAAAQSAFNDGLISKDVFTQVIGDIEATEAVTKPLITEAQKLESQFGDVQTKADNAGGTLNGVLTPAVQGSGSAAEMAGSQFVALGDSIQYARNQGAAGINVAITTTGGIQGTTTGGIQGGTTGGKFTSGKSATSGGTQFQARGNITSTTPSVSAVTPGGTIDTIGKAATDFTTAVQNSVKQFGFSPSGGGGGGGGGGSSAVDDKLASIEEIKAFFVQVNAAILSGIRGGTVFSTAGNAIPLGGPGQFVSSQGGTLIEQVNLRGVWDFADPAAKREIIRQLREALDEFGSEVA